MNHSFDFSTAGKYRDIPAGLSAARFALIDRVIATGKPVGTQQAALLCGGKAAVDRLVAENYVGLDGNGEIGYLYPVSAYPTGHRVRLADGRSFDTMCAIDSLGCAATFGMDAEITSFCKDTQATVSITITDGRIAHASPSGMYVSYYDNWIDGSFNF